MTLLDFIESNVYPLGFARLWRGRDARMEGYVYPCGELERHVITYIEAKGDALVIHLGEAERK